MNKIFSKYFLYYPVTTLKGELVFKYLSNYTKRQYQTRPEIQEYQLYHLKKIVKHAYNNSQFYRNSFNEHGLGADSLNALDDLSKFPTISKLDLADRSSEISTSYNSLFVSHKTTGGSTGQAVTLSKNTDALARERAATWRSYEWAGVKIGDPQARFWGSPLHSSDKSKYKIIDFIANRIRLSAFDITDNNLYEYYNKIHLFKPVYLYGYVSVIEEFARYLTDNNLKLPVSVKCAITTSEVLTSKTKNYIQYSLGIRVFNEYGCGEVGSIAHECEHNNMHIMDDNLILEIDQSNADKDSGEIIVTDLHNYSTPLIRYRLGDFASFSDSKCKCGRNLNILKGIHGRAYDCVITSNGVKHHPELIMYIFEDLKERIGGIHQFQVIQKSVDHLHVKIVKSPSYKNLELVITNEFKKRICNTIKTTFEYVPLIQRENSGKLRLVKSELNS